MLLLLVVLFSVCVLIYSDFIRRFRTCFTPICVFHFLRCLLHPQATFQQRGVAAQRGVSGLWGIFRF